MFRFLSLLHMRSFSKARAQLECKMTNGGPPINDCTGSCADKCQLMKTRDEVDAFIANARCRARCVHTDEEPKSSDCSCISVCIADMSEMYCIMESSQRGRSRVS